jgi:hypothetical protein
MAYFDEAMAKEEREYEKILKGYMSARDVPADVMSAYRAGFATGYGAALTWCVEECMQQRKDSDL